MGLDVTRLHSAAGLTAASRVPVYCEPRAGESRGGCGSKLKCWGFANLGLFHPRAVVSSHGYLDKAKTTHVQKNLAADGFARIPGSIA